MKLGLAIEVPQPGKTSKKVRYVTALEQVPGGLVVRMTTPKGKVWTVSAIDGEEHCDCPSFAFHHEYDGSRCKHIIALADLGLIAALSPAERIRDLGDPAMDPARLGR